LIRDNGSSRAPNSAVHRTRVKQRESRMKPEVATVSLAQGVLGGDRRTRTETEREQSNAGEFPKTLTPCARVHRYIMHTLELEHTTISISRSTLSLRDPFYSFLSKYSFMTKYCKFFSFCTTLHCSNISFSLLQILLFTSKSDTPPQLRNSLQQQILTQSSSSIVVNERSP
jgi:hypothetical protein